MIKPNEYTRYYTFTADGYDVVVVSRYKDGKLVDKYYEKHYPDGTMLCEMCLDSAREEEEEES